MLLVPVVLCGGSGTRLWPVSRDSFPKQFLALISGNSLFQATLERARAVTSAGPIVVTNEQHRFLVAEQVRSLGIENASIMLEPVGRNTAPAIAAAALHAQERNPGEDPLLLVLPSDHLIQRPEAFARAVMQAIECAQAGELVTFGIVPTVPETGYGYIRADLEPRALPAHAVAEFVEKPDLETAQRYVAAGEYFWNSGMFLFRASRCLEELQRHTPAIVTACRKAISAGARDLDFYRLESAAFKSSPSDSIDYAVMEKTDRAAMVPLDAGWTDLGSWTSLADVLPVDKDGNSASGDAILAGTSNTLVRSTHRLVATLGVDDLIVVETADAVLVAHKREAQDVKQIVAQLKQLGRSEAAQHRMAYRPWGHFDSVEAGPRYQVKRISVNPGASLSLQMHHHRAEHWIVVKGTAEVTCNGVVKVISENESTFIPLGAVHRLANPGRIPLEIIEVQSGAYLGEDDIVRFSDDYGRDARNSGFDESLKVNRSE